MPASSRASPASRRSVCSGRGRSLRSTPARVENGTGGVASCVPVAVGGVASVWVLVLLFLFEVSLVVLLLWPKLNLLPDGLAD